MFSRSFTIFSLVSFFFVNLQIFINLTVLSVTVCFV